MRLAHTCVVEGSLPVRDNAISRRACVESLAVAGIGEESLRNTGPVHWLISDAIPCRRLVGWERDGMSAPPLTRCYNKELSCFTAVGGGQTCIPSGAPTLGGRSLFGT